MIIGENMSNKQPDQLKWLKNLNSKWTDYPEWMTKSVKSGWIPQDRDYNKVPPAKWTRAERLMAFCERECFVPEGTLMGNKILLIPFQRMFIRAVYDNPHANTRRAILSVSRKNGKTSLVAPIVLAHIIGPEAQRNSQVVSGAMSSKQANILMGAMKKIISLNPEMSARAKCTTNLIRAITTNVEYSCLARDGSTAQGLSPAVAVLDETGQIVGPRDAFIDAIVTSQGAHPNPLLFVISTQAASDSDLLSTWIDDAARSEDMTTICHVYEADEDCDLLDQEQWMKANPALGIFRSFDDLEIQMARASRMPASEAAARNLLLNQRVSLQTLAVAPSVWKKNGKKPDPDLFLNQPVHVGLDLSQRNDLTSCVLSCLDPDTGDIHVKPITFTPLDTLDERSHRDRAPYDQWVKDGLMTALPGSHMDYDMMAKSLADQTVGMYIATIQFDRWRIDDFKPRALANGFGTEAEWVPCGQGFKDMGLRVDGLDSVLLRGKVRHGFHPLLNLGASNAIVVSDPTGNKKYDKSKSSQRIDTLVALAMSVYPLSDMASAPQLDIDTMII